MPEPLGRLRARLAEAGLPDDASTRLIGELADHLEDLVAEAAAAGMPEDQRLDDAWARLGNQADLVTATLAAYSNCRPAPAADTILMSEVAPRWAMAILASASFTLLLLFTLQLALLAR